MIKLSDIFTLQMGKTPARANDDYWNDGSNSWVSISDLSTYDKYVGDTSETITDLAVKESGIKPVPANTVIMSFKLSIGKTAITTEPVYTNEAIMAFIPNGKYEVYPDYLYHMFSGRDWSKGTNRAVMGATLNKATLGSMEVFLPSIEIQKEIAEHLDKVDAIISKRKQQLSKLDELVKSRFIEMFGDPEINSMAWVKEALCNHLNVVGGYAFKSELFTEEGIPVLRIGNINAGFFQPINMVYWRHDDSLSRYIMYPGDLVMSLTGTVGKDDYGNVCILGNDYDCYYLNQRNVKLELFKSLDKYYLSQILKFSAVKKKLTGISRGVRQANISNKDILNLEIPIPPIELQNEFATFVEQTDKLKSEIKESLEKLETLKKSLMQKYFG